MAAWKHSRQQLRLRLAWLRVFGDDARAVQRASAELHALGWRGRGTAWQSTGSAADRDASRATGNASTRAHIAHSHGTTRPDPSADPDAGAISHTGDHGSMTILATEIQQPQYSGMSDDEIAAALNAVSVDEAAIAAAVLDALEGSPITAICINPERSEESDYDNLRRNPADCC